jgi:hypothetical protein
MIWPTQVQEHRRSLRPKAQKCHSREQDPIRQKATRSARHRKARNTKRASHDTSSTSEANTKSEEKKRQLREKNKVAAAKCRQRQRKQAEVIRAKGRRLCETNAQLKSCVQELRQELNGLRAMALRHNDCDAMLAWYNKAQADRVMREYYSTCSGLGGMVPPGKQTEPQE